MLGRNNQQEMVRRHAPKRRHYALEKLNVGLVSVLVGIGFAGFGQQVAHAQTTDQPANPLKVTTDNGQQAIGQKSVTLKTPTQAAPQSAAVTSAKMGGVLI